MKNELKNNLLLLVILFFCGFSGYSQSFLGGGYQGGGYGSGGETIITNMEDQIISSNRFEVLSYPNPFHYETTIKFVLSEPSEVKLDIYDVNSRLIRSLIPSINLDRKEHKIQWDGKDEKGNNIARGVYYYRFISGQQIITKKIIAI